MLKPSNYIEQINYCSALYELNGSISVYIDKLDKRHIHLYIYSRTREPLEIFREFFNIMKKINTINKKNYLLFELRFYRYEDIKKVFETLSERLSDYKRTEEGLILHKYESRYLNALHKGEM